LPDWTHSDPSLIVQEKTRLVELELARTIFAGSDPLGPQLIVDRLIDTVWNLTANTRSFMEQNPSLPIPGDFVNYPGKLDHAACVCFQVGTVVLPYSAESTKPKQAVWKSTSTPQLRNRRVFLK
jgi:hypothetical protein